MINCVIFGACWYLRFVCDSELLRVVLGWFNMLLAVDVKRSAIAVLSM